MPFDGQTSSTSTHVQVTYVFADRQAAVLQRRSRIIRGRVRMLIMAAVVLSVWSEVVWPESGLITRAMRGNEVANQNHFFREIYFSPETHTLNFEVAGRAYEVLTPGRPLTEWETNAWKSYALRHRLPAYTADGSMAIDP